MAIADFLQAYNNRMNQTGQNRPTGGLSQPKTIRVPTLGTSNGLKPPVGASINTPLTYGSTLQAVLDNSKLNAQNVYDSYRSNQQNDLAQRVLSQSAGNIQRNKYGIVQKPQSNYKQFATTNLNTINQIGNIATQGVQQEEQWKRLNQLQNQSQQISSNIAPGARQDNPGAKALAIAMTAYKNGIPYKWGGTSLSTGVDCSGLVQQAYAAIGIKLPRTTYEQAKSGQIIHGEQNYLPGDLIFYNTGKGDPNGIGVNSHVALYLGNGMILEAANSRVGIREVNINYDGTPSVVVRPWS